VQQNHLIHLTCDRMRLVIMSRFLTLFFYVGDFWMAPDYRSY
jgi:hypothetical protein